MAPLDKQFFYQINSNFAPHSRRYVCYSSLNSRSENAWSSTLGNRVEISAVFLATPSARPLWPASVGRPVRTSVAMLMIALAWWAALVRKRILLGSSLGSGRSRV